MEKGKVYLVGAGPGDGELITLKGLRVLRAADAVVYDRLVSDDILAEIPQGAARIYVGKQGNTHSLPQAEINQLLVTLAQDGKAVVRLKGGDPFIFGRGGEEMQALSGAGIPVEVVPGVSAASGVLAGLNIPLTHRGLANGVRFVTAQCGKDVPLSLDWRSLADPATTLVIYMGMAKLAEIRDQLLAAGMPPEVPALVVGRGTLPDQKHVRASLRDLPEEVRKSSLPMPALIVIGNVVGLGSGA